MKTKSEKRDSRRIRNLHRQKIANTLSQLKRDVRIDWFDNTEDLQSVMEAAIAKGNMGVLQRAYAAAIVKDGMSGRVQWERIHELIQARWKLPNIVEVVKSAAWRTIATAKRRQQAREASRMARHGVETVSEGKDKAGRLKPVLGDLKRFAAYMVAGGLILYGARLTVLYALWLYRNGFAFWKP